MSRKILSLRAKVWVEDAQGDNTRDRRSCKKALLHQTPRRWIAFFLTRSLLTRATYTHNQLLPLCCERIGPAGSGHMVRNKLHWDANNAVGLPKQRNSYQSSPTFLCFESPTASFASQCNLFRTMWPDPAKGLLVANGHFCSGSSWLKVNKIFRSTFCPNHSLTKANIQFFFSRLKWHRFKNSQSQRITE